MFNFFQRKPDPSDVTPDQIKARQEAGERLFFLDVREPSEYAEAHIAGSKLVPLGQLSSQIGGLPKDRPIVAVCHSGNRSSVAMSLLKRAGFTNVLNLRGGMAAWTRSGMPTKRGK